LTHILKAKDYTKDLGFKAERPNLGFCLFAKGSSFSRLHIDGDGVATAVQVESGAKFWAVLCHSEHPSLSSIENVKGWAKARWDVAYLEAGDQM